MTHLLLATQLCMCAYTTQEGGHVHGGAPRRLGSNPLGPGSSSGGGGSRDVCQDALSKVLTSAFNEFVEEVRS
jgi:hypothetical protein